MFSFSLYIPISTVPWVASQLHFTPPNTARNNRTHRFFAITPMGSCLSLSSGFDQPEIPTATVISVNGELKDYPTPITVLQVLTMFQTPNVDQSSSNVDFVICNSDSLCYNEHIPPMNPNDILQQNQIYFLIPTTRLQYRLSATDMAALAVKASVALQKRDGKRKKARISPVSDAYLASDNKVQETITPFSKKAIGFEKTGPSLTGIGFVRSGSIRKLQRYSSRRAKLAVRSFRLMLSTIYE